MCLHKSRTCSRGTNVNLDMRIFRLCQKSIFVPVSNASTVHADIVTIKVNLVNRLMNLGRFLRKIQSWIN